MAEDTQNKRGRPKGTTAPKMTYGEAWEAGVSLVEELGPQAARQVLSLVSSERIPTNAHTRSVFAEAIEHTISKSGKKS